MTDSFDNYSEISDAKMEKNKKNKGKIQKEYDEYLKLYGHELINKFISETIIKTGNKKDVIKKTHISHAFIDYLLRETPKKKVPKNIDLYDLMDKQFGMHNFRGWEGLKINYVKNQLDELDELDDIDEL
jgi:hypothetical protein